MMSLVTKHGGKRMVKRQGLNKKSLERQAELAKERGLHHKDMSGRLHKWVIGLGGQEFRNGAKYIIYNNSLFIFHSDYSKVITVINLPSNLIGVAAKQLKRFRKKQQSKDE